MARQLKRWESPRREGRNDKGKGGSARARQLKKQQKMLRKKLKEESKAEDNKNSRGGKINYLPYFFRTGGERSLLMMEIMERVGWVSLHKDPTYKEMVRVYYKSAICNLKPKIPSNKLLAKSELSHRIRQSRVIAHRD